MKRILLFAALLSVSLISAQEQDKLTIQKGTWTLGGSLSFNNNNSDANFNGLGITRNSQNDVSTLALFPRVGYTFNDNWIVGLTPGYITSKSENENSDDGGEVLTSEFKSETISISSLVRRYFGVGKNLALYLEGQLGYERFWSENVFDDLDRETSNGDGFSVNIRPGISFFASKNLAFETSIGVLGYSYSSSEGEDFDNERQNFGFSLNPSDLFFGLSYFF